MRFNLLEELYVPGLYLRIYSYSCTFSVKPGNEPEALAIVVCVCVSLWPSYASKMDFLL